MQRQDIAELANWLDHYNDNDGNNDNFDTIYRSYVMGSRGAGVYQLLFFIKEMDLPNHRRDNVRLFLTELLSWISKTPMETAVVEAVLKHL